MPTGNVKGVSISIRQIAFASAIGTAIEFYDFILYSTAAALVFPKLFFPNFSPFAGLLASFATFGVGLFARPIGGIVFGHFGDRVGRKSMLVITLFLMGGATFMVGLLPTFREVGVVAPLLLVLLRFLQGFAVGGEWGGATLMAVEHAPEESRNFYGSWPQLGVPLGLMLSTAAFTAFSSLREERFLAWGWRIPFLLSIILVLVGMFIRMRVLESPAFARVKEHRAELKFPLLDVLRRYPKTAILVVAMNMVNLVGFYVGVTFTPSYVTARFGLARNVVLIGLFLAGAAEFISILVFARLADHLGNRTVAICGAGCSLLFCFPFFWMVDTGRPALIWLAMFISFFIGNALYAVSGTLMAELFETRVRYSGISFGYQMAGMLGGAPAPIIAATLVHWSRGASWPVATYLAVITLISFTAVCLAAQKDRECFVKEMKVSLDQA